MIICIKYLAQRKRKAVSENLKLAWLYLWVGQDPLEEGVTTQTSILA